MIASNGSDAAKYPIDSIIKASAILQALSESDEEMGVTGLSNRVGLSISTTHRILDTLVEIGYVQRNKETHRYRLGFGLLQIGLQLYKKYLVHPDIELTLKELAGQTGETAKLGILYGGKMIYLGVVESSNSLRFVSKAGESAPPHCTAMGKVLLAFLSDSERTKIINSLLPLRVFTKNTIQTEQKLLEVLVLIHSCRYAIDDEEYVDGSRGIAVPVLDSHNDVIAAISISGPSTRLSIDTLLMKLPLLQTSAQQLKHVIIA